MKRINQFFAVLAILSLAAATADAQLTWDPTGGGTSDGAGAWKATGAWWDGGANVDWTSGSDAVFGNGGAGGAVTLASPTTVNSLTMNSFTGTYTLGTAGQTITLNNGITMNAGAGATTIISPITLGGNQSWTNNDDSLLTIGTGAVTNGGFLLTVGGTGNTTISSAIGGAGGLTKSGTGTLTLSGSNGFAGQLTVGAGTLSIATINNASAAGTLGNSALSVILGSSGNTGTLSYTGPTVTSTKRFTFAAGGTGEINVTTGANTLTLSGLLDGSGGLTKIGAGTLTLSNNPNQFTGNTLISNGRVALGGQFAMWQSAYDTTGSTGAIGLNVTGQAAPWLGGLAGSVNLATAVTGYGSVTTLTLNPQAGSSVSYGGVIANGAANMQLSKSGHGTQTLTGANSYSGATTVWAGTLALSGASGTALNSAFTVRGGTLELDNSTNLVADRIANGTAISLGSLTLKGFNTGGVQGETVGATTFAVGGKVTVVNGTAVGDRTTLALGAVTRSAGAAIDFVGTNGTLGGAGDTPNVTSSSLPANTNGILDWATVNGTQWAENNSNSIRAYSGSFFAINSSTNAQNAQVSGSDTLSGARVANSLNLIATGAGQSLSLGANNLTLGSAAGSPGAILKSGADAYTISGTGQVRAGSAGAGTELIAHVDGGALTISAPLNTAILGIAKGGTGDLILSGTRAATMSGATSIAGGQLEFRGNGFTLSGVVTGAGGLTVNLNAGQTLTMGNNSNSYAGPTIIRGGYLASPAFGSQGMPGGLTQTPSTNTSQIGSNLILEGGVFYASYVFNKDLGAGPGQVQILAGTSGFVNTANSGGAASFVLDGGRELVWGSTYFNPTVFVHSTVGNLTLPLANAIDLAGSTRTILVGDATYNANAGGGVSQLSGAIRTSSGTAGLTKTGVGVLLLSGASTFNGAVTVSQGTLAFSGNANVASANPLGQSSAAASNLVLANGTTLRYSGAAASTDRGFTINGTAAGHGASLDASGSGAINFTNTASPAYGTVDQTRTLTLTGTNTGNNILAANIADNGTGAVSVTKTGAGLWVLSGTSTYTGPTTLNAGTLSASAVANLGAASSNLVFNGGTFQPTGGTFLNFSSIGHTVVFNSGQTVGLDIASGTFTADQTLDQGTGGLTKTGAGTLVINSAHTYTGTTTISAGTLRFDDGGAIPGSLINNSVFLVNKTGAVTMGTDFPALIGGSGSFAIGASTTYTIGTAGLQFNALNTTGGGSFALSGVTTPVFGGLSGTTGDLSSSFSGGYSGVTNLTLNTAANNLAGNSFTYGGVINDGAAGMSLTKTGAGTQTLTGTNTYTGTTFLNGGVLAIGSGGTIGRITGTTAIEFNGGTLQFNRSTNADIDAINNAAPITVNGSSTFGVTSNDAGGASANETVGAVTLNAGQMNFNWTNGASSGSQMILSGLSRTGTASANFNGTLGSTGRWRVIGGGNTTAGQIIGPWYTTGGANAGFASTDYAVYSSDFVAAANIAGSAETTWTTAANAYTLSGATTLTGTRTITALRYSGNAQTFALGANNLETYGLLNGGSGLLTVSGTGALTTPTGGGNLYVTSGSNSITVNAPINNNGGNVTLVKNGGNTLTLTNNSNNYSGGTVLNAGTLVITNNGQLGVGGGITVNGTVTINGGDQYSLARTLTLNDGALLTLNNGFGVTGVFSGNGALSAASPDDHIFSNAANTFTGAITSATAGTTNYGLTFASIGDTAGAGLITLVGGSGTFRWTSASGSTTTLANRQFAISGAGAGIISALGTTAASNLVINQDLLITGAAGARTLRLIGANTGNNTFAGKITDGPGAVVSLTKEEAGTWILSGANSYTGTTTVSGGTLEVKSLANGGVASSIGQSSNAAGNLVLGNGVTLVYSGTGHSTDRNFTINGTAAGHQATIISSGTGAIDFTSTATPGYGTAAQTRTLNLGGTNTGANTLAATLANNTSGAVSLNKNDAGRWILSGTNTYTGTTSINAGALQAINGTSLPTSSILQLRGGVFQSSGTFTRNVGTAAGNVNWATSSGGFAAIGGTLDVQLNGGNASVTWNESSMVQTGQTLVFGSTSADSLVDFQNALNLGSSGSGQRTIQVNDNTSSTTDIARISGLITNTAAGWGIDKTGAGTLELTNANTYTGATTVTAGMLVVNNTTGSGTGTGTVTIGISGSLGGNGTISGALTVNGAIAPGNSIGILTVANDVTWNGSLSSPWVFELGPGDTADLLDITGVGSDFLKGTGTDFVFDFAASTEQGTFDLVSWDGTTDFVNTDFSYTNLGGGNTGTFQINSNTLQFIVVPEPAAIALATCGLIGLGIAARRRFRRA
jgi:autotransporter-associated beta strand protein